MVPGSPAAKAGIRPGDVLIRSKNRALHNPYDWYAELLELVERELPAPADAVGDVGQRGGQLVEMLRQCPAHSQQPALDFD